MDDDVSLLQWLLPRKKSLWRCQGRWIPIQLDRQRRENTLHSFINGHYCLQRAHACVYILDPRMRFPVLVLVKIICLFFFVQSLDARYSARHSSRTYHICECAQFEVDTLYMQNDPMFQSPCRVSCVHTARTIPPTPTPPLDPMEQRAELDGHPSVRMAWAPFSKDGMGTLQYGWHEHPSVRMAWAPFS